MSAAADALGQIRRLTREHGGDVALVGHPTDLRWAVGFTGSNGLLVVGAERAHFVTDGRYTVQAAAEVSEASVHIADDSLLAHVRSLGVLEDDGRVVFSSSRVTVSEHLRYRDEWPAVTFVPVRDLLAEAVAHKTDGQVEAVRRAQALTCAVFEDLLPAIEPGISELDLAAEIVYRHLRAGASSMSFEPIVAAGPRGAKPHARPSAETLSRGDLVVIDMGCVLDGYCSDMTRTVAVGEPGADARRAYEAVRSAQRAAIEAARAGMTAKDLDAVARGVLEDAGLGDAFTHSLGHGVGLEVHEWPRISSKVDLVLPAGATVTVEPGVYLEGAFGVRIEDVIALRVGGNENLTPLDTDLIVL